MDDQGINRAIGRLITFALVSALVVTLVMAIYFTAKRKPARMRQYLENVPAAKEN
jgi:hypothetical protein